MGDERIKQDGNVAARDRGDRETLRDGTIAVLDDSLLDALGGHSKSVYLSPETAARQAVRHPDIRAGDYARVQCLVDHAVAILEKDRTIVLAKMDDEGKCWRAVVKRTADGRETYLVTFHRIEPGQIAAAQRRGTVVRPGRGGAVALGGAHLILARPEPRV